MLLQLREQTKPLFKLLKIVGCVPSVKHTTTDLAMLMRTMSGRRLLSTDGSTIMTKFSDSGSMSRSGSLSFSRPRFLGELRPSGAVAGGSLTGSRAGSRAGSRIISRPGTPGLGGLERAIEGSGVWLRSGPRVDLAAAATAAASARGGAGAGGGSRVIDRMVDAGGGSRVIARGMGSSPVTSTDAATPVSGEDAGGGARPSGPARNATLTPSSLRRS